MGVSTSAPNPIRGGDSDGSLGESHKKIEKGCTYGMVHIKGLLIRFNHVCK